MGIFRTPAFEGDDEADFDETWPTSPNAATPPCPWSVPQQTLGSLGLAVVVL